MDVPHVVRTLGGIAHRMRLREAGASRSSIRGSITAGKLVQVRRDWVATPDCAPELRRAVEIGARLGCLSAAQHLGLFVIADGRFHVAAPPTASRLRLTPTPEGGVASELVHWATPAVPVTNRMAMDPIENVLIAVANCQPHENAVVVVDSALNKKLVRRPQLLRLATRVGGRFSAVVADSDARADSGLETLPRLRLARRGVRMVPQVQVDGHQVDGLVGERLVLQFDGDEFHKSATARQRDREEDGRLVLQGFTVLRFGTPDVITMWERTEERIMSAIAQGLHVWSGPLALRSAPGSQEIVRITGGPGLV
jgi:very-short-patch-repair endonuclease